jgi:NitT/TauT family transport system substrate-binding protein
MSMKRLSLAALLAFLPGAASSSRPAVKVGVSPVTSTSAIYIAQERGYFKDEGLDVELVTFPSSGAPMTVPLSQDQLHVGAGNLSAGLWNAIVQARGLKLVADKGSVLPGHCYMALLVRKDLVDGGRFKSLRDLKGLTLALTAMNGVSQEILVDRFLAKGGLAPGDVRLVKMSYQEMNVAFRTKDLDATIQLEPYLTQAVLEGLAVRAGDACEVYPGQQSAAIIYSAGFARDEAAGVKFMTAYLRGARDYEDAFVKGKDREAVTAILKKHLDIRDDAVWREMAPAGINPDGRLNLESLEKDLAWYKAKGYLTSAPDLKDAVDHRFVERALKKLGRYK